MSEMIERVARAIFHDITRTSSRPDWPWEETSEDAKRRWRETAVAVIGAMREPTEVMLAVYDGALKKHIEAVPEAERTWRTRRLGPRGAGRGYKIPPHEKALCRWRAMLDAALLPTEPPGG